MISICVADHTGHIWLSGFDQAGFLIFGHSADEMMMLKEASEKVRKGNYERLFDEGRRRVRAWEQANVK